MPKKKSTKKMSKKFDKEKVEDFIQKNSTKEDVFKKPNKEDEAKKGKTNKKKKGTSKVFQEKPKFNSYAQIHKKKLSTSPHKGSLIEDIYGNIEDLNESVKNNEEKDEEVEEVQEE